MNPICLEQAMEVTVRIEEKHRVSTQRRKNLNTTRFGNYSNYSKGTTTIGPYTLGQPTSPPVTRTWGSRASESQASVQSPTSHSSNDVKRLTESELQEKRAKGLCYRCDAKWAVGHRCKKKELSVMFIAEDEGETEGEDSDIPASPTEEILTEVSLNSVVGISNPKTMKLKGLIGHREVIVMIDPNSTHNFISLDVATEARVQIERTIGFGVFLGNGEAIWDEGVYKGVTLQLFRGLEVVEDFFPLKLGSFDVILGISWLEKLGMVLTDWKTQVMKFEIKGEPITLVADPSLVHSQISLKAMKKTRENRAVDFGWSANVWKGWLK